MTFQYFFQLNQSIHLITHTHYGIDLIEFKSNLTKSIYLFKIQPCQLSFNTSIFFSIQLENQSNLNFKQNIFHVNPLAKLNKYRSANVIKNYIIKK